MSLAQVCSDKLFHRLFMECLSEQRRPTEGDIHLIAGEIWRTSHGCATGQPWDDVAKGSDAHRQMLSAARAALGVHIRRLNASSDQRPLVNAA